MTSPITREFVRSLIKRDQLDILKVLAFDSISAEIKEDLETKNNISIADDITASKLDKNNDEDFKKLEELYDTYLALYDRLQVIIKENEKKEEEIISSTPVVEGETVDSVIPIVPVIDGAKDTSTEEKTDEKEKAVDPEPEKIKVVTVVPEENQTEEEKEATKKGKKWWKHLIATLGVLGIAAVLIFTLKGCGKDANKANDVDPSEPVKPDKQIEINIDELEESTLRGIDSLDINNIDIENYSELTNAAKLLQSVMPEDSKISIEQIQYAIVLANLDKLPEEKQQVFREAEEIYSATYNAGILIDDLNISADDVIKSAHPMLTETELNKSLIDVTDAKLTLDNFKGAKTENGYDLYKVLEICGGMIDLLEDEDKAFEYAKVFNDIVAQTTRNFTMPQNAKEEEYSYLYTVLGMYNANLDRILELCGGRHLSTIYGSGIRNDGSYGDICVEELAASSHITHKNGTYSGPGKFDMYVDANGVEYPDGYVYFDDNGNAYVDFVTMVDENGEAIKTETYPVSYLKTVTPNMMLDRDGDYIDALCDENNKGIGR